MTRRSGYRGKGHKARLRTHTTTGRVDETLLGIRHDRKIPVKPHCPNCGRIWRTKGAVTHLCKPCIKNPDRKVVMQIRMQGVGKFDVAE